VAEELYDNTINFIENTDKIPEEQKVQMDADLLLEAFIENNTPTVIEKALPFDELVEKITTEFSIDNTELLGSVLTTKNGEQFDQNVVSDKFILLSKITSFDIASFTINIQYALGQVNQDGLLTIYEREEPIECSYVLQPSLKLDQQQMLDWFNSLDLHVNQSISYDFLTDKGGFEYNQYQNKLEIGSTYSYSK
jgi:hypothetical protein